MKVKKKILKFIAKQAYSESTKEVNSACAFWGYQIKVPDKLKKLRKF